MPPKLHSDSGAPEAQKRLEAHEADAESNVLRIKGQLDALRALSKPNGEETEQRALVEQIGTLERSLNQAYDLWFKLTKQVREYDKAVSQDRREGVKILQADAERILTQAWRFQRIGREAFVIGIAQEAIHCTDEKDFYSKYADIIRGCEIDSLKAGLEHEKFPAWVLTSYSASL